MLLLVVGCSSCRASKRRLSPARRMLRVARRTSQHIARRSVDGRMSTVCQNRFADQLSTLMGNTAKSKKGLLLPLSKVLQQPQEMNGGKERGKTKWYLQARTCA